MYIGLTDRLQGIGDIPPMRSDTVQTSTFIHNRVYGNIIILTLDEFIPKH